MRRCHAPVAPLHRLRPVVQSRGHSPRPGGLRAPGAAATPGGGGPQRSRQQQPSKQQQQQQQQQQRRMETGGGGGGATRDMLLLRQLGAGQAAGAADAGGRGLSAALAAPRLRVPAGGLPLLRQGAIDPSSSAYRAWRGLLIGAAAFTGIFVPWELGFGNLNEMYQLQDWAAWVDLGLVSLFLADLAVSYCVAYEADELLVDEPGALASSYRRQRLLLDVLSAVPFDWLVLGAATALGAAGAAAGGGSGSALDVSLASSAGDALGAASVLVVATSTAAKGAGVVGAAGAVAAGASAAAAAGTAAAATASATAGGAAAAVAAAASGSSSVAGGGSTLMAIACLKGLHLVRLYRVRWFFRFLEYDLTVNLLTVTVARNLVIVLYLTHWVACGFLALARGGGYDPDLMVGLNPELFTSISVGEQYMYSLYWAVTTLAGNEWNGMDAVTDMRQVVANTFRASVFLLFNIALGAYILGTITLLVVKNDERTGRYRDLSSNLKTYSTLNRLPPELKDEMQEHLKLKFNNQDASDDQVLAIYPTAIRRRILRHLYLRHLRSSYLFRGAPRKFLDALLASCRLELFRPGVDLLAAGDAVNELLVVVAGRVELRSPLDPTSSAFDWGGDAPDSLSSALDPMDSFLGDFDADSVANGGSLAPASAAAAVAAAAAAAAAGTPGAAAVAAAAAAGAGGGTVLYAGPRRILGPGELLGEISFFTEIPQMETVSSQTTVRVMVISRGAYESLERAFPIASRLVLENLRRRSEAQVAAEFPGLAGNRSELQQLLASCPSSLMYSWASPELVELMMSDADAPASLAAAGAISPVAAAAAAASAASVASAASGSWDDVLPPGLLLPSQLINSSAAATADASTTSGGESDDVSSSSRGAAGSQWDDLKKRQLEWEAQQQQKQQAGTTGGAGGAVVAEAAAAAAPRLAPGSGAVAVMPGVPGSGTMSARQELVLSNLVRVTAVINTHMAKQQEDRTTEFLYAATRGDVVKLRSMLQQGFAPDSADYDGRTALMLACVRGHRDVVELLLSAGADARLDDNLGRCALLEACYHGHDTLIDVLLRHGVRLSASYIGGSGPSGTTSPGRGRSTSSTGSTGSASPAVVQSGAAVASSSSLVAAAATAAAWSLRLASLLCSAVYECNLPLLRRLLRAGAPVNAGDYDLRTPLHVSAAEGNLVMVRALLEEGGADILVQDRWGHTPLDEARRVGAGPVAAYLVAAQEAESARRAARAAASAAALSSVSAAATPSSLSSQGGSSTDNTTTTSSSSSSSRVGAAAAELPAALVQQQQQQAKNGTRRAALEEQLAAEAEETLRRRTLQQAAAVREQIARSSGRSRDEEQQAAAAAVARRQAARSSSNGRSRDEQQKAAAPLASAEAAAAAAAAASAPQPDRPAAGSSAAGVSGGLE